MNQVIGAPDPVQMRAIAQRLARQHLGVSAGFVKPRPIECPLARHAISLRCEIFN